MLFSSCNAGLNLFLQCCTKTFVQYTTEYLLFVQLLAFSLSLYKLFALKWASEPSPPPSSFTVEECQDIECVMQQETDSRSYTRRQLRHCMDLCDVRVHTCMLFSLKKKYIVVVCMKFHVILILLKSFLIHCISVITNLHTFHPL